MPDAIHSELASLALAKLEAKAAADDLSVAGPDAIRNNAPAVYGAGLSDVLGKFNLQSALVSMLIQQAATKGKEFAVENRDAAAQWVADQAEELTKDVIDWVVKAAESFGA